MFGPLKWPIKTIFIEGQPKYEALSSTIIRDMCSIVNADNRRASISCFKDLLPENTIEDVIDAYCS